MNRHMFMKEHDLYEKLLYMKKYDSYEKSYLHERT